MQLFREILEYKAFFREFTLQQMRSRYRGSVLGFLWTLLTPLLLFGTFGVIFSYINRADLKTFLPFFFAGYIPWLFFTKVAESAVYSVVNNAVFVSRVRVPRGVFPLTAVAVNLPEFGAIIAIAVPMIVVFSGALYPASAVLPLAFAVLLVFVTGVAYLFALLNVFFRDFSFLWVSVSFLWFFLTPILYPMETLSPGARQIVALNPFLPFVKLFQEPLTRGAVPSVETWAAACGIAAVTFLAGTATYQQLERRFYEYL